MDLKILIKIMNLKKIVDEVLLIFQLLSKQKRVFQIFIFISYRETREQKNANEALKTRRSIL